MASKTQTKKKAPAKTANNKSKTKLSPAKKPSVKKYTGPKGGISTPEVEILKKRLEKEMSDKRIKTVEIYNTKALVSPQKALDYKKYLIGAKITAVYRDGLSLLLEISKTPNCPKGGMLAIQLGEGGQLKRAVSREKVEPETIFTLGFTQILQLRLIDRAGGVKVYFFDPKEDMGQVASLRGKGLDLIDAPITWQVFYKHLRSLPPDTRVKDALLDSNFIIGIGDVYSDEILYRCRLRYDTALSEIPDMKIKLLLQAAVEILYEATKFGGTSLNVTHFLNLNGEPGGFQDHLQVFGRDGQLTPTTLHQVERVRFKNRWVYYCPRVQV